MWPAEAFLQVMFWTVFQRDHLQNALHIETIR
jgi:hypothetical protein